MTFNMEWGWMERSISREHPVRFVRRVRPRGGPAATTPVRSPTVPSRPCCREADLICRYVGLVLSTTTRRHHLIRGFHNFGIHVIGSLGPDQVCNLFDRVDIRGFNNSFEDRAGTTITGGRHHWRT